ncbi:MAG TPA: antitoxin VapB family protein [Thermoplasmata archaeon]|nr:antitoxin VapB family protein [Thermoplasmata archaeon]
MVARTISLSEDAYHALAASKRPGESFSDVVRRLVRRRSLTDLVGVVDRKAADAITRAIEANRRDRLARRRKELGLS